VSSPHQIDLKATFTLGSTTRQQPSEGLYERRDWASTFLSLALESKLSARGGSSPRLKPLPFNIPVFYPNCTLFITENVALSYTHVYISTISQKSRISYCRDVCIWDFGGPESVTKGSQLSCVPRHFCQNLAPFYILNFSCCLFYLEAHFANL